MAKRLSKASGKEGKQKRRKQDDVEDKQDFFLMDDDNRPAASESEEEEAEETAEEKRLRLAREYLEHIRAAEEDEGDIDEDAVAEKLRIDALEASGRLQRHMAHLVSIPAQPEGPVGAGRFCKGHRLSATAVALTADDATAYAVSKDGAIFRWDVETMKKVQLYRPGQKRAKGIEAEDAASWVKKGPRQAGRAALFAAAVSSDGKFLAVGGGDRQVHVFDAASGQHLSAYSGHRDLISGLVFQEGTHTLMSGSFDRTVKLWSLDDEAYVDTLFGHQAEVYAVDALRQERAVSSGHDHTCRVWKIPEESQLVFRAPCSSVMACRYLTSSEWISGACDGNLQLWSTQKKKPIHIHRGAHSSKTPAAAADTAAAVVAPEGSWATAGADTSCWVQSVAVCRGSDLVASGAGDGFIRLWGVTQNKQGGAGGLREVGELPAPGFVNGLSLAKSGRFVLAAMGQEPRLGRWGKYLGSKNGLLLHRLEVGSD